MAWSLRNEFNFAGQRAASAPASVSRGKGHWLEPVAASLTTLPPFITNLTFCST